MIRPAAITTTATSATPLPVARAPGFLKAPDATRPDSRRLPTGSPKRERGNYALHPIPLPATTPPTDSADHAQKKAAEGTVPPAARFSSVIRQGARSACVAARLGGTGGFFAAARATARTAATAGTAAGEQSPTGTARSAPARATGRLGRTAGRFSGTAGGFGGTAGWLSSTAGRFGSGAARRLGCTSWGTVAAFLAATTSAGSRGGVGEHHADGNGTQDGKDHGNTLHKIYLVRNRTGSQNIHIDTRCSWPRPTGLGLLVTVASGGTMRVVEKPAGLKVP